MSHPRVLHRTCKREVCSAPFETTFPAQRYCSDACREKTHAERVAHKPVHKPCRICGTVFKANNPNGGIHRSYCSDACKLEGLRLNRRSSAQRVAAGAPPRKCEECRVDLADRRRRKCDACLAVAKAQRLAREAERKRLATPIKRRSSKPVRFRINQPRRSDPSFNLRDRGDRGVATRAQIDSWITLTPIEVPLPSEPRAALVEALNRHPAFRAAFAEHHGIQIGRA